MSNQLKTKRRWYQFGLRSLLLLVTLVSCGFGWIGNRLGAARTQQNIVQQIRQMGGRVLYDYRRPPASRPEKPTFMMIDGVRCPVPSGGCILLVTEAPSPPGPEWLRNVLGKDFFSHVNRVILSRTEVTDADLVKLHGLTRLEYVNLEETNVSDQAIAKLQAAMPNITVDR